MIFYLVRHGQTDWNSEKRFQGRRNIPMNEAGIRQISDLANKIMEKGIRFDILITSPLDRAKKSAEIIAERTGFQKDILFDEDFVERDCGLLEGEVWRPELNPEDPGYGMETKQALYDRARRVLEKYRFSNDERVMIVSHGAILSAVTAVLSDRKGESPDRTTPVIQGNILCCVKEEGSEAVFFNLFD